MGTLAITKSTGRRRVLSNLGAPKNETAAFPFAEKTSIINNQAAERHLWLARGNIRLPRKKNHTQHTQK